MDSTKSAILLISCPDCKGIVAAVTQFLSDHNGNILHLDQHVDSEENIFFMRVEWDLAGFGVEEANIREKFQPIGERFQMDWGLRFSDDIPRMAVFVSKMPHCLFDILSRYQAGEWNVEIPLVISNHADMEPVATQFGIEYRHIALTRENKREQEQKQLELLQEHNIDLIVLARYMQIISETMLDHYENKLINIHHSFLPAFPGAKPYHSAHARGVKIIGATSHYVTHELDAGPIIAQDVISVSHKDSVADLVRKGKDLERIVLARAIWHHLQNKILVYNNKTVIFE